MYQKIKRLLYFPVASYFRFFAAIRLRKWNPKIIVITGSTGKTTLLHLIESQLGNAAKYSHEANSSFGIPFDILDIHRKDLTLIEWPKIFLLPFVNVFKPIPKEKIYIVEADCDRPHEGDFLSSFLNPEVTLWTNVSRTHSMNFDSLIDSGKFNKLEEAIAYEFAFFIERTKGLVVMNADNPFELGEIKRSKVKIERISMLSSLKKYNLEFGKTEFNFGDLVVQLKYLTPKEVATSILMTKALIDYLNADFDKSFANLILPPGRNSVFKGIKGTTIVDSTYNVSLDAMMAILNMFAEIKSNNKWVILGDILEQGKNEEDEHKRLANLISQFNFKKVILLGPRVSKYTYPELKKLSDKNVDLECFINPKDVLNYVAKNLKGEEILLFKGVRFMEGIIEHLLENKEDIIKLSRREKIWEMRRKKWGL